MKKLILASLLLLSVFFSQSYGMFSLESMMSNMQRMMLKRNVLLHIIFGSISRCSIQCADSIGRERFSENVHTEEDERALDALFPNEEIKEERDRAFDEYERLLQEGALLSVITVEEFDESFGDEEQLEEFICKQRKKEINKILCSEEIDDTHKVAMISEFKKTLDPFVNVVKEKLGFLRQIIEEKQELEADLSALEKEDERLQKLMKKIAKNRYSDSEVSSSDESGEFSSDEFREFSSDESREFSSDESGECVIC